MILQIKKVYDTKEETSMGKAVDYLEKCYKETNYNCAEAVFSAAVEAWGIQLPPETVKVMAGFGGGMGCGSVCGAVTGGCAALSCKFVEGVGGHTSPKLMKMTKEFVENVQQEFGSEDCHRLKPQFYTKEERCYLTIRKVAAVLDQVYEKEQCLE